MKKIVVIDGMHCAHCSSRVEKTLNEIDGIKAKVVLEDKKAYLELSKDVSNEIITAAVEDAGFDVISIE